MSVQLGVHFLLASVTILHSYNYTVLGTTPESTVRLPSIRYDSRVDDCRPFLAPDPFLGFGENIRVEDVQEVDVAPHEVVDRQPAAQQR